MLLMCCMEIDIADIMINDKIRVNDKISQVLASDQLMELCGLFNENQSWKVQTTMNYYKL